MKPHILTRGAVGAAASLAVIAPLTGCGNDDNGGAQPPPSSDTPIPPSLSQTPMSEAASYEDGTYTVRGVYGGAPSYMDFTVTLEDGVIMDVDSELMPDNNDTSRGYQERFAAEVPDEVVGESIADLEVGVIAGASGCADGFNDALAKIRDEAATN